MWGKRIGGTNHLWVIRWVPKTGRFSNSCRLRFGIVFRSAQNGMFPQWPQGGPSEVMGFALPGEHIGLVILAIVGIICYPVSILSWEPRSVKREIDFGEKKRSYVFFVIGFFCGMKLISGFHEGFFVAFLKVVMIWPVCEDFFPLGFDRSFPRPPTQLCAIQPEWPVVGACN